MVFVCPPPPRYLQRAEFSGINAGAYTLSTYWVPYEDNFPPAVADYPIYFNQSVQFEVLGQPVAVDSTTIIGLSLLALFMLLVGFYYTRESAP